MQKPNIVFINSRINESFAGGHTVTKNILKHFRNQIEFSFIGRDKFWTKMFQENNFKTYKDVCGFEPVILNNLFLFPVSFLMGFYFFLKYFKDLKEANFLVFNASFTEIFFLSPWVKLLTKTEIIHTLHGGCPTVFKKTWLGQLLKFLWGDDQVIFVSKSQLQEWKDNNIAPKNAKIIFNGVEVNEFIPNKKPLKNTLKLGFIGRLEKEKGIDFLISSLQESSLNFNLKIAGKGSLENGLREQVKNNNKFDFNGSVSDIGKFLSGIDLLICPSLNEAFGLVVCEAWERGMPVVCSNIKVFKELKSYTNTFEQNLIFESKNGHDLLKKIEYFIANKQLFCDGKHQLFLHQIVKENFSIKQMMLGYKNIFEID
jgi:glycosyltransferase involved in cell wall biosynthesis